MNTAITEIAALLPSLRDVPKKPVSVTRTLRETIAVAEKHAKTPQETENNSTSHKSNLILYRMKELRAARCTTAGYLAPSPKRKVEERPVIIKNIDPNILIGMKAVSEFYERTRICDPKPFLDASFSNDEDFTKFMAAFLDHCMNTFAYEWPVSALAETESPLSEFDSIYINLPYVDVNCEHSAVVDAFYSSTSEISWLLDDMIDSHEHLELEIRDDSLRKLEPEDRKKEFTKWLDVYRYAEIEKTVDLELLLERAEIDVLAQKYGDHVYNYPLVSDGGYGCDSIVIRSIKDIDEAFDYMQVYEQLEGHNPGWSFYENADNCVGRFIDEVQSVYERFKNDQCIIARIKATEARSINRHI